MADGDPAVPPEGDPEAPAAAGTDAGGVGLPRSDSGVRILGTAREVEEARAAGKTGSDPVSHGPPDAPKRPAEHPGAPARVAGDVPSISRAASGLSALARAEARAQSAGAAPPPADAPRVGGRREAVGRRSAPRLRLPALPSSPRRSGLHARRRRWSLPRRSGRISVRRARRGSAWGRTRPGRLRRLAIGALAAVVAIVVLGGVYVGVQLTRSVPRASLVVTTPPAETTVRARPPVLPWPRGGEAAVAIAGFGTIGVSGPSAAVPIASLAKVMVALVVLHDHPLRPGQTGPQLTMSGADQALYQADEAAGDSVAPVFAGETLSELQLLQALMVPSADNVASILAAWDAGSETAFLARMNAMAAALHMSSTHYADANGLSSSTVSTASDQLRLAEDAAQNPVLMGIVDLSSVSLPGSVALTNYDTLLGRDGIVGIKTGSTSAAGGCFMFAAERTVAGHRVEVLGAVLGQDATPWLTSALDASAALVGPAFSALHPLTVLQDGTDVARVSTPWGAGSEVETTRSVSVLGFPGMTIRVSVRPTSVQTPVPVRAGYRAATVTVDAGDETEVVPAATTGPVPGASLSWRLGRL